jgi:hypothetical protein
MNSTYDVKEIGAIVTALCDWMASQHIKEGHGVVAMLRLSGVVIGRCAKTEDALEKSIEAMTSIFTEAAALSYVSEQADE